MLWKGGGPAVRGWATGPEASGATAPELVEAGSSFISWNSNNDMIDNFSGSGYTFYIGY
jgi:hypothetical protein